MARVPYVGREELAESDRDLWDRMIEQRGAVGHIHRAVMGTPNLFRRFLDYANELRNGTQLEPKLRELALMTVGRITGATYEFTHHWNISLRVGVTREQLEQLAEWKTSSAFNDLEKTVIGYACEATTNIRVSDSTFNALRGFLDNRRILELVQNVAFYNMVVRILEPLQVDLEPGAKRG
ncbi:MAG TPA: carboxymuconolactone decarboxylase family protein [Candidatus Binataceae bacterium]|jgi:alkylhydroperoxidase family enzyme